MMFNVMLVLDRRHFAVRRVGAIGIMNLIWHCDRAYASRSASAAWGAKQIAATIVPVSE